MKNETSFKKIGAETILVTIIAPIGLTCIYWFVGFVMTAYNVFGEVSNQKDDIAEIKKDVKAVRNYLINKKNIE